jgi:hypothetical protein
LFCQGILDIEAHRRGRACRLPIIKFSWAPPTPPTPTLASRFLLSPNSNQSTIEDVPLAHYAARHWWGHALFDENVSLDIQDGLTELFDPNRPHFMVWAWICDTIHGFSPGTAFGDILRLLQRPLDDRVFALYIGSEKGSVRLTQLRLTGRAYSNARAKGSRTPLRRDEHDAHLGNFRAISKDSRNGNAWDIGYSTPLAWALNKVPRVCLATSQIWIQLEGPGLPAHDTVISAIGQRTSGEFVNFLSPVALMWGTGMTTTRHHCIGRRKMGI